MNNILIITYYFPPMPGIGGVRLYGLAKYLPRFGWNPIILTRTLPADPDSTIQVIQTPYHDVGAQWKKRLGLKPNESLNTQFQIKTKKDRPSIVDRLAFIPSELIAYPDGHIGWYEYAVSAAEKLFHTEQLDAIISSSYFPTCHLIANQISKRYAIPWIADYRDLWTQNHYYSHSRLRSFFEKRLEIKTLNTASTITTVSKPLADRLKELHKNKQVYSIPNGFDPELVNQGQPLSQKFKILYTGTLYQGKRDPSNFFALMKNLCNSKFISPHDIEIDFFGQYEDWLIDDIKKYHLQNIVMLHGQVPRETAIAQQRKAQILLLLTWNNTQEKGVYTGKLFDYLAARRPILSMGYTDGGVVKELLDQTQAGVHCSNEDEIRDYLLKAYREYKQLGAVQYRGIEEEVMKYSHREMARKFAKVLDEVTSGK